MFRACGSGNNARGGRALRPPASRGLRPNPPKAHKNKIAPQKSVFWYGACCLVARALRGGAICPAQKESSLADSVYYAGGLVLIGAVVVSFLFAWRMDRKERGRKH